MEQTPYYPVAEPVLSGNESKYVNDCLNTGWISSQGKYVLEFEQQFAKYCNTEYALAVSNGTVAIHLALVALGIGPGDEVIIPDLTFAATANAVLHTGASIVLVDIDTTTWCIDPQEVIKAITPQTKAIMPVHLYGHPANMSELTQVANEHDLLIIEDAAEAHGASINNSKVGGLGDCGCFSFFANKIITSGEGGMITTNNSELYNNALILRDHGMSRDKKYWHEYIGFNYRLTNIQAAIGLAQLEKIDEFIVQKRNIASWYQEAFAPINGITFANELTWAKNVYWMSSIQIDELVLGHSRDSLIKTLKTKNIEARPFFYPLHEMPVYQQQGGSFPISSKISKQGINLPSSVLLTKQDVSNIANTLIDIIQSKG